MDRPHLIFHSLADGHLGCFPLLSIVNNAPPNICVPVFVWSTYVSISLRHVPRSGIDGPYGNSVLNLLRSSQAVFQSSCTTLQSTNSVEGLNVSIFPSLFGLGAPKWAPQRVTRTCHWSPHAAVLKAAELTPYCLGRPTILSVLLYMCLVSHYPLHLVESTLTCTTDLFLFLNSFSLCKIISAN